MSTPSPRRFHSDHHPLIHHIKRHHRRIISASVGIALLLSIQGIFLFFEKTNIAFALSNTPTEAAIPYGTVNAVVKDAATGKSYVGGSFSYVGNYTGSGVPTSTTNGTAVATYPKVNGSVITVISDGSSGWYIGGAFTKVGGISMPGLAHITSDGVLDSSWSPQVSGGFSAAAALLLDSTTLYVGGSFTSIGGQTRNNLAAISTTTALATSWNPNVNNIVHSLVKNGTTLYVGGEFTQVGGSTTRNGGAAYSTTTGSLDSSWNPNMSGGMGSIEVMLLDGSNMYMGGSFTSIGGQTLSNLARINLTSGAADAGWSPNPNQKVLALAMVTGGYAGLFVGGEFASISGGTQHGIARIDTSNGTSDVSLSEAVGHDRKITSLIFSGGKLYIGGSFTSVLGLTQENAAGVDTSNGTLLSWNPHTDGDVSTLAISGSVMYVGGSFASMNPEAHQNLAAIDSSGLVVSSWTPTLNGTINALNLQSGKLYVGGTFTTASGSGRNRIAAYDTTTGSLDSSWNPNINGTVCAITSNSTTLYVAGDFSDVNSGTSRSKLVALELANSSRTGTATSWQANGGTGGPMRALALSGNTLYAGGDALMVGGQMDAPMIGAFDITVNNQNSNLLSWRSGISSGVGTLVDAIAVQDGKVYIGGTFSSIGGTTRNNLVAVSATTGSLDSWNPNVNGQVNAIVTSSDSIYVGGAFSTIGGTTRNRLASIKVSDASLDTWNPSLSDTVYAISSGGGVIEAGGRFRTANINAFGLGISIANFIRYDNPSIQFVTTTGNGAETTSSPTIQILIGSILSSDVTVNYTATGGTATGSGTDYTLTSGTATIAAGSTTTTIPLTIINDTLTEKDETIIITLSSPSGATLGINQTYVYTILANDDASTSVYNTPQERIAMPYGDVTAIAKASDGTTYVGGIFGASGGYTGSGAPYVVTPGGTATLTGSYPKINGMVASAIDDGSGGWYILGDFTSVGGYVRNGLAHIKSNGTTDPDFRVNMTFTSTQAGFPTFGTLIKNGSKLYVAGSYSSIGGVAYSNLAVVDSTTGAVDTSWHPVVSAGVSTMAIANSKVYIGGMFTTAGGQSRGYGAAFSLADGATSATLASWNPQANGRISSIVVSGSTAYIGGEFSSLSATGRNNIAAVDLTVGTPTSWNPGADGAVNALAASDNNYLYVGGDFTNIASTARNHAAAFTVSTGGLASFDPNFQSSQGFTNATIKTIAVFASANSTSVIMGGRFDSVGGVVAFANVVRLYHAGHASSGTADSIWQTGTAGEIETLGTSTSGATPAVFIGGVFKSIGGGGPAYLMAIDKTGNLINWDPAINGKVNSLTISGTTLYVGGSFSSAGGSSRGNGAAFNLASSRALTSWNPGTNGEILNIAIDGSTAYISGRFTTVNSWTTRLKVAALDTSSGWATAFNSGMLYGPDSDVAAMAVSDGIVYIGGDFTSVKGANGVQTRTNLAAINPTSGDVTSFAPTTNGLVKTMAISNGKIYVGGMFSQVTGAVTRNRIAAFNTDGSLDSQWNPNPNPGVGITVYSIVPSSNGIYIGGDFTTIRSVTHPRAALLEVANGGNLGAASTWNPILADVSNVPSNPVYAISEGTENIDLGGRFENNAGTYLARYSANATLQFTSATGSGSESAGTVNIPVALSTPAAGDVTFKYAVYGGTATQSSDYTLNEGNTVTITAGSLTATIPLVITDDIAVEGSETVIVSFVEPTNAILGASSTFTYTITDNDVVTAGVTLTESSASTGIASGIGDTYTLVLDGAPSASVTITPTASSEILLSPASVTFTTGNWSTPQTIAVSLVTPTSSSHTSTITHSATSSDVNYSGIAVSSVVVSITGQPGGGTVSGGGGYTIGTPKTKEELTAVAEKELARKTIEAAEKKAVSPVLNTAKVIYESITLMTLPNVPGAKSMAISLTNDFAKIKRIPVSRTKKIDICTLEDKTKCGFGIYKAYIQFYDGKGAPVATVFNRLYYLPR